MSACAYLPKLRVIRRPGASGPVLSVAGALTEATAGILKEELDLLSVLGHPMLTLDLSGCRFGDTAGMLTLLEILEGLGQEECRLVIVAGTDGMARLMKAARIDHLLPVYATEEEAARALRLAGPLPLVPMSWEETRDTTIAYWQEFKERIDEAPAEELLRDLTMMTALCERAEELFQHRDRPAAWRCQFCPLFHALGGRPHDVGCRSLLDPIIAAVRAGDLTTARDQVDPLIRLLEAMPWPTPETAIARN
jgi:anti-anti-sigma factor